MLRCVGVAALAVALTAIGCADRARTATADGRLLFIGETDFQRVPTEVTREMRVSLKNVGRSPLNVLDVRTEDSEGAYLALLEDGGSSCELLQGGKCEVLLRFRPTREGNFPAFFVARSDSSGEPILRVPLRGVGVNVRVRVFEKRLDFGRIELGSEKVKSLRVQNPSDLSIVVTPSAMGADQDEFHFQPVELAPFETRTLDVVFRPTRVGQKRAALGVAPCDQCDAPVMLVGEGLDRAIVPEPATLDFGQVPMDRESTQVLTLRNISTEPQAVTAVEVAPTTDPSFRFLSGATPVTLQGGETREFLFHYGPGHMGAATGDVVFSTGSPRHPQLNVPLVGWGGAPELCVSPSEHRWSPQPVGAKVSRRVTVKNCGASNSAPLTVSELVLRPSDSGVGGGEQFSLSQVSLPRTLAAGQEFSFFVFYEPTSVGEHAVTLAVRTSGLRATESKVQVYGNAEPHLPCQVAITPAALDFGTVLPNHSAVLGVKVHNTGSDVCPVKNIEIQDDGGGAFRMPGGELPGVIVHPGYYFSFMVQFDARETPGTVSGWLKIEVSDPARPVVRVPLVGNVQASCIVAKPPYIDFGITRPDCPFGPRSFDLENVCATPVGVSALEIGPGTTDGEFAVSGAPSLPMTFAPRQVAPVEVQYRALSRGMNLSPLYVGVDGLSRPLLVPLVGESTMEGEMVERFVQQDGRKVDILFVVDNTASMIEEHPKLVAAMPTFVSEAQARNVDLHLAVTTTGLDPVSAACPGGALGGEAGRLFPVDNARPRILTLQTPDLASALQANVQVGQCAFREQGLEALQRALSTPLVDRSDDMRTPEPDDGNAGFLRSDAALLVVFVGDEDDHSPDSVDSYVDWLRSLKGQNQPQRSAIYAIAPTASSCSTAGGTGTRYTEAAARTGGEVLSVCASSYAPILQRVASQAFAPQDGFVLGETPEPGSFRVLVNGTEWIGGWTYDSARNQIVFASTPVPGTEIEVRYRRACGS